MADGGEKAKEWSTNWECDWEFLQQLLPQGWQGKARELGAMRRGRVITSAQMLLRVMLICGVLK